MTGEEFRALRELAGVTQAKAARALGVAPQTVYRWERAGRLGRWGRRGPETLGVPSRAAEWIREAVESLGERR